MRSSFVLKNFKSLVCACMLFNQSFAVLDPLKTKITEFEKRIEDSFNADIKERYSLGCQITKMA